MGILLDTTHRIDMIHMGFEFDIATGFNQSGLPWYAKLLFIGSAAGRDGDNVVGKCHAKSYLKG
jgi:hypothetical protein